MRAQGLRDVAAQPPLRGELHWLEPLDVSGVEEHEADDALRLVNLEGIACQHCPLDDELLGVHSGEGPGRNQLRAAFRLHKGQQAAGWEEHRRVEGGTRGHLGVQEAHKLEFPGRGCGAAWRLREGRPRHEPPEAAMQRELLLRLDDLAVFLHPRKCAVDHRHLLLAREHAREHKRHSPWLCLQDARWHPSQVHCAIESGDPAILKVVTVVDELLPQRTRRGGKGLELPDA
mmetsp:Transcript_139249/g.388606  ORF Transcript_139249/g.388606 Transcript_139249/m.388606 type:complete len:231 (+) Transcript_139249:220-912(+)